MSASQDKSQRFTFVGSNLYQIHSKGVEPSQAPGLQTGQVLKSGTKILKPADIETAGMSVRTHEPKQFAMKSVFNADLKLAPVREHETTQQLQQNLKDLENLHSRLRFMLHEIKGLITD